jgi:hypothetical protein
VPRRLGIVLAAAVLLTLSTLTSLPALPALTAFAPIALAPADAQTVTSSASTPLCDSATARWQCLGETFAASPTGRDWSAADLQGLYDITDLTAATSTSPTVAVVEAYGYPDVAADLATYRSAMGLPACTEATGCLRVVNQDGTTSPLPATPSPKDDWTGETALDLDVVSAVCPSCRLLVVEADDDTSDGLFVADRTAASMTHWVSDSWGNPGSKSYDTAMDVTYLDNPDTILTVASGDDGYTSKPDYPSTSPYAVAVGGVAQEQGGTPTAWSGTGSSCADFVATPTVQQDLATDCSGRAAVDVSALAYSSRGIRVYDSMNGNDGWVDMYGTSASAPMVAAMYAAAGNFTDAWAPYTTADETPSLWTDVTSGSNSTRGVCSASVTLLCTAGVGWDGPTGVGMPTSPAAFAVSSATTKTEPLDVTRSTASGTVGKHLSRTVALPRSAEDTSGKSLALTSVDADVSAASDLPAGLSLTEDDGRLVLTGTPTRPGHGTAVVPITGATADGDPVSGGLRWPWVMRKGRFVATTKPVVVGTAAHGRAVRLRAPVLRADTGSGAVVRATLTVVWTLAGHSYRGTSLRLGAHTAGERLAVTVKATRAGYRTWTWRHIVGRVR